MLQIVRDAVKEEVSAAVREQGVKISDSVLSAMRSGAVTPANVGTPDPMVEKQHVLQLLRQGQLNAAFQQVGWGYRKIAKNLDTWKFAIITLKF